MFRVGGYSSRYGAVEVGGGRDEANPVGTRVHTMEKQVDIYSGGSGQEELGNNELLCRISGLVRTL